MNVGDLAPDFVLPDETGTPRRLSDFLQAGPVVLFFYPGAMTKGCTAESCHFRDLASEFAALGAQRMAVVRTLYVAGGPGFERLNKRLQDAVEAAIIGRRDIQSALDDAVSFWNSKLAP